MRAWAGWEGHVYLPPSGAPLSRQLRSTATLSPLLCPDRPQKAHGQSDLILESLTWKIQGNRSCWLWAGAAVTVPSPKFWLAGPLPGAQAKAGEGEGAAGVLGSRVPGALHMDTPLPAPAAPLLEQTCSPPRQENPLDRVRLCLPDKHS